MPGSLLLAKDQLPPGMNRLQLEVFINEQPTRLIGEIYRAQDGNLLARREEMASLGILAPGTGGPRDLVPFNALPELSMRYVETEQKLYLSLPDRLRLTRLYDLHAAGLPPRDAQSDASREVGMVVNYNAYGTLARGYASSARAYTTGTLSLDGRLYSPYGVVQNSTILGTSLARREALRLETAYVHAHRESATTTTLGDAISGGLNWTRPVRFGGAQISRAFGLRPDLVTAPLPSVSGSAAVPSTVDVYIDNMRIASQEVGAGPYRLTNLPVSGESGTARVVVRDITGKETSTTLPFFTSAKLLAPQALDFSLDAGYPRRNYALESFDYSRKPMGQGSLRYGLRDTITLEGHAEGMAGLALAGGGATFNAGRWGILSLDGAGSRDTRATASARTGGMIYGAWQASLHEVFLGVSTQRTFGPYTDVAAATTLTNIARLSTNFIDSGFFSLNRSARVARSLDRLSIGRTFPALNASASASLILVNRAPRDVSRLASFTWSQTFAKSYNTFVTVFSDFGTTRQTGVMAGLSFTLGSDILITTSGNAAGTSRSGALSASRPLGQKDYDYGWRLYDNEGRGTAWRGAEVQGRTPYARLGAGVRQDGAILGGSGEIDGAVVAAPGGVHVARRISDAFAIVDVGTPGVEVLVENRPVGRTDRSGKMVVSELISLQPAKIAIAPETLPGESHASLTEAEVIPGFRGSATVNIHAISPRETARVELRDGNGQHFPAGTRLVHQQTGDVFTIGYGGLTFLPGIKAENTLLLQQDTRSCTVSFRREERRGERGHVGPLTCALH